MEPTARFSLGEKIAVLKTCLGYLKGFVRLRAKVEIPKPKGRLREYAHNVLLLGETQAGKTTFVDSFGFHKDQSGRPNKGAASQGFNAYDLVRVSQTSEGAACVRVNISDCQGAKMADVPSNWRTLSRERPLHGVSCIVFVIRIRSRSEACGPMHAQDGRCCVGCVEAQLSELVTVAPFVLPLVGDRASLQPVICINKCDTVEGLDISLSGLQEKCVIGDPALAPLGEAILGFARQLSGILGVSPSLFLVSFQYGVGVNALVQHLINTAQPVRG